MFCAECGCENINGAKFCKNCGKELTVSVVSNKILPAGSGEDLPKTTNPAKEKKNKTSSMIKIAALAVAAAAVAIFVIISKNANTIDLNKYLIIEAVGYNGYGKLEAEIDWDAMAEKYGSSKISELKDGGSGGGRRGALYGSTPYVKFDRETGLANGDSVSYSWVIKDSVIEKIPFDLKHEDGIYVVEGLTEIDVFDPFDNLNVEFSGVSPKGTVEWEYTGNELTSYDFSCDPSYNLKEGDVITIKLPNINAEYMAERYGRIPMPQEKQYTVDGLDRYVSDISEIPEDTYSEMKKQAEDKFQADVARGWSDDVTMENMTYIGSYLLTNKNRENYESNQLYLIYKINSFIDFSDRNGSFQDNVGIYWYIRYNNIMVKSDGSTEIEITNYQTPYDSFTVDSGVSNGWWGTHKWTYNGYDSLEGLYKEVVTSQLDNYNHVDNVDESLAPAPSHTVEESEGEANENGYILPDSNKKVLTKEDLSDLSEEECKLARNEIYARHGRKFKDEKLQAHFDACDWYEGKIEPDDFDESILTDIEIQNKNLIVEYEKEKGYN